VLLGLRGVSALCGKWRISGDGYGRGDQRRDRGSRICGGLIGRMMRMGLTI